MIEIRQATLADKAAIFRFLDQAYAGRSQFKHPARWEWAFEHNPFLDNRVPVWIALAPEGQVVGQSAALVEPLVVNGQEVRVGWGVDFYVLPDFRGQGLGTRLQAANQAAQELFMSLSIARGVARIKETIGMQALPEVPVYTRILRHQPESVLETLSRRYPILPAGWLKTLGVHTWLARRLTGRDEKKLRRLHLLEPDKVQLEPVEVFGADSDRLWQRIGPQYSALVRRDAGYLNWKFGQQPHLDHRKWIAYREGEPCGHLVLRRARPPERDAGILADLFTAPGDRPAVQKLLTHALYWFSEQDAAYMQCASSVPAVQELLVEAGFRKTGQATPMASGDVALPREGWLLGKGDHDWDQYPLA